MINESHPGLVKLREKHARELQDKMTELDVIDRLPDSLRPFCKMVHIQRDGEVWVSLARGDRYRWDGPKHHTLREADAITHLFEVIPTEVTQNSTTSTHALGTGEKDKGEVFGVFPWTLRVNIHGSVEFFFYAAEPDGRRLRVTIDLGAGLAHRLRRSNTKEYAGGRVRLVERTDIIPVPGMKHIKWATGGGGGEWPNEVGFYVEDVEAALAHLEPEEKPAEVSAP